MDYENQVCWKGWIGDGCRLRSWGLIGVLPSDVNKKNEACFFKKKTFSLLVLFCFFFVFFVFNSYF